MSKKNVCLIGAVILLISILGCSGCCKAENETHQEEQLDSKIESAAQKPDAKVTFIEIGSLKCIPCKMMQPIMKEIEEKYKNQVKVVFYDVWTAKGKPFARKYGIRVIPTQVFLDKNGKEYFRHEGFFAKDELIKVLKMQGVK